MEKVREILRQRWTLGLGVRTVALALGVSRSVVSKCTLRAERRGLSWEQVEVLDDGELSALLYGGSASREGDGRAEPDVHWIHRELRRPGVTLELLHLEYLEQHPEGYRYTAFCSRYRRWLKLRGLSMRQVHRGGEKAFVDYSGKRPHYTDPDTGQRVDVELFVGVLGASNYTFAEATRTQQLADWCGSHVRMLEYFGGVPRVLVPDQLRSAVREPCRYEPTLNRSYERLAQHYGTAVVPARPRKPKDKAKAERAVQVAQRWILARLRHEQFFSLADLNVRIRQYLDELNDKPMRRYGGQSRRELFAQVDVPALSPLPDRAYEYSAWSKARVHLDYHVEVDRHYYSVPYALVREVVEVCLTATTVQLLHKHRVVASHARSYVPYAHTTNPAHMPKDHQKWLESDPAQVQSWARSVGPMTEAMVARILELRPEAQQGLRSAMGLMRVGEKYESDRVEAACTRALRFGARSYKPIAAMLRYGRERDDSSEPTYPSIQHSNVRGPDYFN